MLVVIPAVGSVDRRNDIIFKVRDASPEELADVIEYLIESREDIYERLRDVNHSVDCLDEVVNRVYDYYGVRIEVMSFMVAD